MKVVVNRARCTGIGICESIAPEFFEVGDDGVLIQVREFIDDDNRTEVEEAVRSCPATALTIVDD
jgi:ferredoxin